MRMKEEAEQDSGLSKTTGSARQRAEQDNGLNKTTA
ncbi:MAG: hypothetical protein JWO93_2257 [Micrococcaceae bacterium]|nr:hypothetical protein [Micrococcaceae bacterium]